MKEDFSTTFRIIFIAIVFIILYAFAINHISKDCEKSGGIFVWNTRGSSTCYKDGLLIKSY